MSEKARSKFSFSKKLGGGEFLNVAVWPVGSAVGIRLLTKEVRSNRSLPWLSLIVSLAILPFIGLWLVASVIVAALGFVYGYTMIRNRDD
jgi:hypothetical protein